MFCLSLYSEQFAKKKKKQYQSLTHTLCINFVVVPLRLICYSHNKKSFFLPLCGLCVCVYDSLVLLPLSPLYTANGWTHTAKTKNSMTKNVYTFTYLYIKSNNECTMYIWRMKKIRSYTGIEHTIGIWIWIHIRPERAILCLYVEMWCLTFCML